MLKVVAERIEAYKRFDTDWRAIESRADGHFFTSYVWVRAWLKCYQPKNCYLLRVYDESDLVGIGLFSISERRVLSIAGVEVAYLQQTGDSAEDQIWIEYNGVLSIKGYEYEAMHACCSYLLKQTKVAEAVLAGVELNQPNEATLWDDPFSSFLQWRTPSFGVDLAKLRGKQEDYLSSLNRNTRYQITRSERIYAERGAVQLHAAQTVEEALGYLQAIAPLHIKRWGSGSGQSGFANPKFLAFHEHLIKNCWDVGCIDLLRLSVNGAAVGYLYNFRYRKHVYFYLGAFKRESDNRLKPGYLAHAKAVQQYLEDGINVYDFMGGDESYKYSLACQRSEIACVVVQRRETVLVLERLLKKLKGYVTHRVDMR